MSDVEAGFDRALAEGRRRGALSVAELAQLMPINRMGADELAATIARLEDAGIEVELDPDLLAARLPGEPTAPPTVTWLPEPEAPAAARPWPRHDAAPQAVGAPAAGAGARASTQWLRWAVVAAIVLACLFIALAARLA